MNDSGHTWSHPEDFLKATKDLEASRSRVKELELNLAETVKRNENQKATIEFMLTGEMMKQIKIVCTSIDYSISDDNEAIRDVIEDASIIIQKHFEFDTNDTKIELLEAYRAEE